MTLGTSQGVTDLCGNTDDDLIERTLIKARAQIANRLAAESVAVPTSDVNLDTAVEAIAAKLIATAPGAVNPRTNYEVDGFKRSDGSGSQLDTFQDIADGTISEYIASTLTTTSPLPTSAVVGRMGVRVGEYEEMTTAQEDEY